MPLGAREAGPSQIHRCDEDAIRLHPQLDRSHVAQAANEKAGTDEQDDRERRLREEERVACSRAVQAAFARSLAQYAREIGGACADRGDDPSEQSRRQGNSGGVGEDATVDRCVSDLIAK